MKNLKPFVLFITLFFAHLAQADLWKVTQDWSPEKEEEYGEWLAKNAKIDLFSKPLNSDGTENPYYGLRTDCADTVYSLRFLFSYEQGLPWAMKQPWNPKKLITQATRNFDRYPAGPERIKKFLEYLYDIVGTKSLENDTYPISIENIRPGAIIVTSHKNHHSWTIAEIKKNGNPRLIYNSSVGKQSGSELQQRISWPNPFWVFEPEEKPVDPNNPNSPVEKIPVYRPGSYAGLRYWIPINKLKEDITTIDGYSQDQFELELGYWKMTVQRKLAKTPESIQDIVMRLLTDACSDVKQRVSAVQEAQDYKFELKSNFYLEDLLGEHLSEEAKSYLNEFRKSKQIPTDHLCLTPEKYDQYSTPNKDKRLFDALVQARAYFAYGLKTKGKKAFSPGRLAQIAKIFSSPLKSLNEEMLTETQEKKVDRYSICQIQIGKKTLDLAEVKRRVFNSTISSNPNEDLEGRWGFRGRVPSELASQCPTYGEQYPPYDLVAAEKQSLQEIESYEQFLKENKNTITMKEKR